MTKTWILLNQGLTVFIFIFIPRMFYLFWLSYPYRKSDTKHNGGIYTVFFHLYIRPDEIIWDRALSLRLSICFPTISFCNLSSIMIPGYIFLQEKRNIIPVGWRRQWSFDWRLKPVISIYKDCGTLKHKNANIYCNSLYLKEINTTIDQVA